MKSKTEKKSAGSDTKSNIMSAAKRLFAEHGYESTNVSDIVKSVNATQGTFYYYYEDKKSILIEMIDVFFESVRQAVSEWAESTDSSADAVNRFAMKIAGFLHENREVAAIVRNEGNNSDPEVRKLIHDFYEFMYSRIQAGLELGVSLGAVRKMNTRIAAIALFGMVEKVVVDYLDGGDEVDIEEIAAELTSLQTLGVRP